MKTLTAALLLLTSCALYPRTGNDALSRHQQAAAYRQQARDNGWSLPVDEVKVSDVTASDCLARAHVTTTHYSDRPTIRALQKRHLWPVRSETVLAFWPVGPCVTGVDRGER